MRLLLSVLLFLMCSIAVLAQPGAIGDSDGIKGIHYSKEQDQWFDGSVQLDNGKVVKGKLNYNYVTDVVTLEKGDELYTFTSEKVVEFHYYKGNEKWEFYSLPLVVGQELTSRARFGFYHVLEQDNSRALLSKYEFYYDDKTYPNVKNIININTQNMLYQSLVDPFSQESEGSIINDSNWKIKKYIYLISEGSEPLTILESTKPDKLKEYSGIIEFNRKSHKDAVTGKRDFKFKSLYKGKPYDLFPGYEEQIKEYINEHHPDLKREHGWVELFQVRSGLE
ncbi:hypothetical protein LVD15_12530 [Fulvivirga maritima]|uniref:hypothetical protein n=1 Tax=Fulvivirga maritima TaxID=2904247 RepID=UPI001F2BF46C|nr:hypothetical protein [Fulvivirga maritima]UII29211.1 hypothetical protein LVD15_12530 [Fulvivirga maritima]